MFYGSAGILEEGLADVWSVSNLQDKATSGKQGLGIKDRPKKIAGVRFQGKKTSFSDDDDDEESYDNDQPAEHIHYDEFKIEQVDEPKLKLKNLCKQLLLKVHFWKI